MARYGQRPENALQRANEFIDVGKPERALETLQEVFRSKKWVYSSSESVLEPIMFKYLELCVDLKKTHIAKEGLFQYRNMFQSVNVGSLETVIRTYLRMAEERTENARLQSTQAVIDIDDLDNLATPESILLSAVSGEDAQDRSDRTILIPWVKFLWESYCQCLELLRTNAYVEHLYHDIARMTFQFCLRYNRKTEFRKLCDKLRKHLADISKLPVQASNVSMSKPETQQLNLETRLYQLDSAIQIELWQEAHRAIEDIHGLMSISKRVPLSKTMANYYQKLAMVFWKMGNHLFHAAALFKHFQLLKEMKKNITQEELQRIASRVLIATLSIPLPSAHPEFDRFVESDKTPLEKAQGLAVLLGLPHPPTRIGLLNDLTRLNVISLATPQLQDLYAWLEVEFDPLLLCSRVQSLVKSLEIEENTLLLQYVPSLQDVTLVHLICQIAQVYQTIEFSKLLELSKFATQFRIERLIVDCVRHNDMQIRINHGQKYISFGIDLSESQREDSPKGPNLQCMPSEQVRNQLVNMFTVLHQAISIVNPATKKDKLHQLRGVLVKHYHDTKAHQRELILKRHQIIEDRKEYIEHLNTVREEEEQRVLVETQRQQALAEQKRLEEERLERERKRALSEIQQIKDRQVKEKIQQISQTSHGQKILKKLDEDDIKKMDADQIAAREAEELQKERRELQAKLKSQEKRIDYLERAKRLEEIPLLEAHVKERENQDEHFWNQQEEERIKNAIEERKLMVIHQARLSHMKHEKEVFLSKLFKDRNVVYEDKLKDFDTYLEGERKKRLEERRKLRLEEKREKWIRDKQEEEERKREEEQRREEEEMDRIKEIERKEQEEREQAAKEERENKIREDNERLERSAAKQKKREEEIENRMREEREASKQKSGKDAWRSMDGPKRGGDESDSWRKGSSIGVTAGRTEESNKGSEPWRSSRMRDAQPSSSWRDDRRDPGKVDERREGRSDDRREGRSDDRREGRSDDRRDQGRSDDRRDQGRSDDRRDQGRSDDRRDQGRSDDRRDQTRTDDRRSYADRRDDRDKRDDRDRRDIRRDDRDKQDNGRDKRDDGRDKRDDGRDRRDDRDRRDIRRDDRDRRDVRRDDDRSRDNVWRTKGTEDDSRRAPPRSKEAGDWRRNGSDATAAPRRDEKREVKRPPPPMKTEKPRSQDESDDGWLQVKRSGR